MLYSKVIFVSYSDTSRGPLAAALFAKTAAGLSVSTRSRGIVVLFPEPVNPKTVAVAKSRGIDLSGHMSKPLSGADFGKETLVLAIDESLKQKVYDTFTEAVNVYGLKEFVDESGRIQDPYGGELSDYGKMYEGLAKTVQKVAEKLKNTDADIISY